MLNLATPTADHQYGVDNTIFSLGYTKIRFHSDEDVQKKGVKLRVQSHRGEREREGGEGGVGRDLRERGAREGPERGVETRSKEKRVPRMDHCF